MTNIVTRPVDAALTAQLVAGGLPPFLARLYAARGISDLAQLDADLKRLIPPEQLRNAGAMAKLLADAIAARKKLLIVADYDAGGATARLFLPFGSDQSPFPEDLWAWLARTSGETSDVVTKEMYSFQDKGGRQVALRFDLTVPLARFVAEHQGKRVLRRHRAVGEAQIGVAQAARQHPRQQLLPGRGRERSARAGRAAPEGCRGSMQPPGSAWLFR